MKLPQHYPSMTSRERREVRTEYERQQKFCCYHCGKHLMSNPPKYKSPIRWSLFPGGQSGFLRYPIHLHHDHTTGMTIGAVHAYCNAVLWQFHGE